MAKKWKYRSKLILVKIKLLHICIPDKYRVWEAYINETKKNKLIIKEKERIYNIPRYQIGIFKISDLMIKFVDSASFLFMYHEIFEKEIYRFKAELNDPLIIDCGSNIGISVLYFKLLYSQAKIIAFEPDPDIFKILKENCTNHKLTDVDLINNAVWDSETVLDFYAEGSDGGRIATISDTDKYVRVPTVRLKDYLSKDNIDFLKVDIEGAELRVIEDCKDVLKNVKLIFIEYHSFVDQPQDIDRILSILKDSGFRLHINSPGLTSGQPLMRLNTYANMDMQLNIYGFRQL